MATIIDVAEKFNVTPEQVGTLKSAMERTWNAVYYDLVDSFEGGKRELYETYGSEAEMVAETTLDTERVTTFCPDLDLEWVYQHENGEQREDVISLGEATWAAPRS